jgi:hypothetical protein
MLLVLLAVGALSASLALLMAHLHFPGAANIFAVTGAICGLAGQRAHREGSGTTRDEQILPGAVAGLV